jgi:hypothetical protein
MPDQLENSTNPEPTHQEPAQEPTPMLDVHPPHHAASTWRDFFIHIATIVIGLLIAIGLEQTVEHFHHRHLVAETRTALDEEKQENIRSFHENVANHIMAMTFLHNNLRIFQYLREHPSTPQDKLPGILYWPLFSTQPVQAAWTTAQHTDVLSLMPREEVSKVAATYAALDYAWQAYQPVIASLTLSTSYYTQTPDITRLSPADIDAEIAAIRTGIAQQAVYGNTLSVIGRQLPEFRPVPSWWQMNPFFTMKDYYAWARQHPELNAPSQRDIDQARAFAGLPPDTDNEIFHYYTKPIPDTPTQ